jgi:hypothetical protein
LTPADAGLASEVAGIENWSFGVVPTKVRVWTAAAAVAEFVKLLSPKLLDADT